MALRILSKVKSKALEAPAYSPRPEKNRIPGDGASGAAPRVVGTAVGEIGDIPSYDPNRLHQILDGDHEKIQEFVGRFIDDFPSQMAALEEALLEGDFQRAEFAAHTMRGSGANLGFMRIHYAAGCIEDALRSGSLPPLDVHLTILRSEMGTLRTTAACPTGDVLSS